MNNNKNEYLFYNDEKIFFPIMMKTARGERHKVYDSKDITDLCWQENQSKCEELQKEWEAEACINFLESYNLLEFYKGFGMSINEFLEVPKYRRYARNYLAKTTELERNIIALIQQAWEKEWEKEWEEEYDSNYCLVEQDTWWQVLDIVLPYEIKEEYLEECCEEVADDIIARINDIFEENRINDIFEGEKYYELSIKEEKMILEFVEKPSSWINDYEQDDDVLFHQWKAGLKKWRDDGNDYDYCITFYRDDFSKDENGEYSNYLQVLNFDIEKMIELIIEKREEVA